MIKETHFYNAFFKEGVYVVKRLKDIHTCEMEEEGKNAPDLQHSTNVVLQPYKKRNLLGNK